MPVGTGAALTLLAPEDHPAVVLSAQMRGIVFTGILAPEPAIVPSPGPADTAQAATTPAALLRTDHRSLHSRGAGAAIRTARLSAGATEHRGLPGRSGRRHARGLRRFCSRRSGCCWSNGSAARLSVGSTLGGRRRPWSPAPPGRAAACFCSARWWAWLQGPAWTGRPSPCPGHFGGEDAGGSTPRGAEAFLRGRWPGRRTILLCAGWGSCWPSGSVGPPLGGRGDSRGVDRGGPVGWSGRRQGRGPSAAARTRAASRTAEALDLPWREPASLALMWSRTVMGS